jgi:hypothetical protein
MRLCMDPPAEPSLFFVAQCEKSRYPLEITAKATRISHAEDTTAPCKCGFTCFATFRLFLDATAVV